MNLTVAEIAKRLNVTTTTIYKAIKTNPAVKAFVTKNGERKTLIDEQAIALLADSIRIQSDRIGSNPDSIGAQGDTGAGFKPETAGFNPDSNLVELIQTLKNQIESKDGQIHELLGQMRDKDHRHDTIIMTLSKQLNDQAKQIEELRKPAALLTDERPKVVPIRPAPPKQAAKPTTPPEPAEPETIGQRLAREVMELFQPWRKRAEWKTEHRKAA